MGVKLTKSTDPYEIESGNIIQIKRWRESSSNHQLVLNITKEEANTLYKQLKTFKKEGII